MYERLKKLFGIQPKREEERKKKTTTGGLERIVRRDSGSNTRHQPIYDAGGDLAWHPHNYDPVPSTPEKPYGFEGQGGQFGGAGATGSWDAPKNDCPTPSYEPAGKSLSEYVSDCFSSGSSHDSGSSSGGYDGGSSGGDSGGGSSCGGGGCGGD